MTVELRKTKFSAPVKRIFDSHGTHDFQRSLTMYRLQSHLERYLGLVHNQEVPKVSTNGSVSSFVSIFLDRFLELIDETPPTTNTPRRFGNMACRDWHAKVQEEMDSLWRRFLPIERDAAYENCIIELRYYLGNAFGSPERLDYGTGHELSFLAVVVAVDMLGLWETSESGHGLTGTDLLYLWNKYYSIVHKLILTYTLEPAGSHGVWGLDDHIHLAYIIGASQWSDKDQNAPIQLSDILDMKSLYQYEDTNLYCNSIAFVMKVKSGPFSQHSPMLYDISRTVPTWSKATSGLIKMYQVEVLNKFPVVQHFWFGTGFFPWVDMKKGMSLPNYELYSKGACKERAVDGDASEDSTTAVPTATGSSGKLTTSAAMPPPRMTTGYSHHTPSGRYTVPRR
ncbi:peptidylprolyl isomerase RRD1 Ecym_4012 [Eremothecium cymbalariae DBVPG|uniref:Serine/threonine-protein phosphatase 2A activator n=1 Tax=Eremothecium cymbalariae (strain CBS 270.75 / DBVPG 7215 / KCTC 17166 / NRRL Y-17582) TaxID=931890 RepID=G8JSU3_ERECY|nr:hypothetical protein Ecym_4012 [Eremothecium cymbalariae DBVPG\